MGSGDAVGSGPARVLWLREHLLGVERNKAIVKPLPLSCLKYLIIAHIIYPIYLIWIRNQHTGFK